MHKTYARSDNEGGSKKLQDKSIGKSSRCTLEREIQIADEQSVGLFNLWDCRVRIYGTGIDLVALDAARRRKELKLGPRV